MMQKTEIQFNENNTFENWKTFASTNGGEHCPDIEGTVYVFVNSVEVSLQICDEIVTKACISYISGKENEALQIIKKAINKFSGIVVTCDNALVDALTPSGFSIEERLEFGQKEISAYRDEIETLLKASNRRTEEEIAQIITQSLQDRANIHRFAVKSLEVENVTWKTLYKNAIVRTLVRLCARPTSAGAKTGRPSLLRKLMGYKEDYSVTVNTKDMEDYTPLSVNELVSRLCAEDRLVIEPISVRSYPYTRVRATIQLMPVSSAREVRIDINTEI